MIDVMQTAKHGLPDDHAVVCFADRRLDSAWGALTDAAVRAPPIDFQTT